jgi:hypothetical protein
MIILMWGGAIIVCVLGYVTGANVKRAFYESRVEELEAQRDAARAMLDHARYEIVQLQDELDELSPISARPEPVVFCAGDNVGRLLQADAEQARLVASMRDFVGG